MDTYPPAGDTDVAGLGPSTETVRPSKVVITLIERIRACFRVPVEMLDANMLPLVPMAGGELASAIEQHGPAREAVAASLRSGRAQPLHTPFGEFLLQPLRAQSRGRRFVSLLSVRTDVRSEEVAIGTEGWLDLLRAALEADTALTEGLREERLESRRALAALRFLAQVADFDTEEELTRAVVHASAVWFDVEARIYRRTLSGGYAVHTHLPGAHVEETPLPLTTAVTEAGRVARVPFVELPEDLRWSTGDVIVLPLPPEPRPDWLLVLGGTLPASAETVLGGVAETLGAHLISWRYRRAEQVAAVFQSLVTAGEPPERIALKFLRQLLDATGGTAGSITFVEGGNARRVAVFGSPSPSATLSDGPIVTSGQLLHPIVLDPQRRVIVDVRGEDFNLEASRVFTVACGMLHTSLAGGDLSASFGAPAAAASGFVQRIREELERAKRFDLRLSMVLIDLGSASAVDDSTLARVADTVRKELRGSDVLGPLDRSRIAALLIHTDESGFTSVVPRLQRRVADVSAALGVAVPRFGRAAFTDDCRTADALVMRALESLEPIPYGES